MIANKHPVSYHVSKIRNPSIKSTETESGTAGEAPIFIPGSVNFDKRKKREKRLSVEQSELK